MGTASKNSQIPTDLLIPMKLDAFIFNHSVVNAAEKQARIAPIIQHNYTFLRMEQHMAQSDLLPHADLHYCTPPERNPRFTDLGSLKPRTNRLGVYLHWILPRPFRSGSAGTATDDKRQPEAAAKGIHDKVDDPSAPIFPQAPNRWLVVRRLDPDADTTKPQGAPIAPLQAWVIESDRMFTIDDLGPEVDLQVDVAPFITSFLAKDQDAGDVNVRAQAEVFIGACTPAETWPGEENLAHRQRVGLSVASSSNQLFPDYQYHCGNVFSMLDTFSYVDGKTTKSLESAQASYYVVGWQTDPEKDLLKISKSTDSSGQPPKTRQDRLRSLNMELNAQKDLPEAVNRWLKDESSARSLCHGAMYNVDWCIDARPPKVPADECALRLHDHMPVAVGTTAMDALITYVASHHSSTTFEEDIYKLRVLLRAADDSLDAHETAADELASDNFMHLDGGTRFLSASQTDDKPAQSPSLETQEAFRRINAMQRLLDSLSRRRKQLRWDMFAIWWQYISDTDNEDTNRRSEYKQRVEETRSSLTLLDGAIVRVGRDVDDEKKRISHHDKAEPKASAAQEFCVRRDPTLLVAGVSSGWPTDFQNGLKVRLDTQLVADQGNTSSDPVPGVEHVPEKLRSSAAALLHEFENLSDATRKKPSFEEGFFPLYHDGQYAEKDPGEGNPWRDRWNATQPWFPLYMEWEGQYIHIPKDVWGMMEEPSEQQSLCGKTRYGLTTDVREGYDVDTLRVSGRSLILPQPSFTLKGHIDRIKATIPEDELEKYLTKERRDLLDENLTKFAFLSAPLQAMSSHVKPLIRVPGQRPIPLVEAQKAAAAIGMGLRDLEMIDDASDPTPYGPNMTLLGKMQSGFKPATHGQFRFTKLNVIDKFGQAVSAIEPVAAGGGHAPLYPCIGEFFTPQKLRDGSPNVVDPRRSSSTEGECEFLQLPMGINQPARLNSAILSASHGDRSKKEAYWRPAADWEQQSPIWGLVMVNRVDRSLQLFLPDGTFYTEVRVTTGTSKGVKWRPWKPEQQQRRSDHTYMDRLLGYLLAADQQYLLEFISMIDEAIESLAPPPTAYGQFLNALTGRPLALVNIGWSLELAEKPLTNQSTLESQRNASSEPKIIPDRDGERYYKFPLKLGNRSRMTDGLVCYFNARADRDGNKLAEDLDLSCFYTYAKCKSMRQDDMPNRHGQTITPQNFPRLSAFWIDPEKDTNNIKRDWVSYETDWNHEIVPFGGLIDPFLPVHAYSGILPTAALRLPTWTWESALKKMVTFFHAGPLVVVQDVPPLSAPKYEEDGVQVSPADGGPPSHPLPRNTP